MSIETAFDGRLGAAPIRRCTGTGKPLVTFSLAVSTGNADGAREWVSVAVFAPLAEELPTDLNKGERLYVEGKLRVNRWAPADGTMRANLQVTATRVIVLDRIGRRHRPLTITSRASKSR